MCVCDEQNDKGKEATQQETTIGDGTDDDQVVEDEDTNPLSPSPVLPLLIKPPPPPPVGTRSSTPTRSISSHTSIAKKTVTGFNPVWKEKLGITFDYAGDIMDLVFVSLRFVVIQEKDKDREEPLAVYCARWEVCNVVHPPTPFFFSPKF